MSPRTWAAVALGALAILGLAIATGGQDASPAAGHGDQGWIGGLYGDGFGIAGEDYIHLERAALVAYAAVVALAVALPARAIRWAILVLVAAFAAAPVLLSQDVFSYISYARLEAVHDLNPYGHSPDEVPGDPTLEFLRDNRSLVSVYGPLFTIISLPLAGVSIGAAVYSVKVVAALSVLACVWIVARLAAARGQDPRPAAALVGLNPLVLVHVVGGGHNDALMAALMTAGIAAASLRLGRTGGATLITAAAVKSSALLALPFALLGARTDLPRLAAGAVGAAGILAGVALAAFGSGALESVEVLSGNQALNSRVSLPVYLSDELTIELDTVKAVCLGVYAVSLAGLLAWVARGADWIRATGWAFAGLLLATSYLTPWYAIWLLPPAALARDRALVVVSLLISAFMLREQVPLLGG
ncbi:MAG: hypothetical protein K0S15_1184 [Solirubrobacterales bacterium]|jgi:alpha-1,6-mannosyltransferase|nr:hypothetical protein [Solirubrobacterales bacterium]